LIILDAFQLIMRWYYKNLYAISSPFLMDVFKITIRKCHLSNLFLLFQIISNTPKCQVLINKINKEALRIGQYCFDCLEISSMVSNIIVPPDISNNTVPWSSHLLTAKWWLDSLLIWAIFKGCCKAITLKILTMVSIAYNILRVICRSREK